VATNEIVSTIKNRRSVRKYTGDEIPEQAISLILEAGRWAPSGLNNQPWKFAVIKNGELKDGLSGFTSYGGIITKCNACIAVFYDTLEGYNRDKDVMSIGACIQNMLLAASSLGIGSVWLGEILNRKSEVNSLLGIDPRYELMAVIALGYPDESPKSSRKEILFLTIMRK
jgi:nitroreductase